MGEGGPSGLAMLFQTGFEAGVEGDAPEGHSLGHVGQVLAFEPELTFLFAPAAEVVELTWREVSEGHFVSSGVARKRSRAAARVECAPYGSCNSPPSPTYFG